MTTTCINCNKPIDTNDNICSYCGITYFNLTQIDFTSHTPIPVRFRIPIEKENIIITMFAIPEFKSIQRTENTDTTYTECGVPLIKTNSIDLDIDVSFRAIKPYNDSDYLCTISREK